MKEYVSVIVCLVVFLLTERVNSTTTTEFQIRHTTRPRKVAGIPAMSIAFVIFHVDSAPAAGYYISGNTKLEKYT